MNTETTQAPGGVDAPGYGQPTWGSLLSAEILRLRSRRLVKAVLAAGLLIFVIVNVLAAINTGPPSAADLAKAQQQAASDEAICREGVKSDPAAQDDASASDYCTFDASNYGLSQPFDLATGYRGGVLAIILGVSALMFLIGASAGGAEWSARTMPALLYWEPRRLRVMVAKMVVLAGLALGVSVIGQALWLLAANGLQALNGSDPSVPLASDFWSVNMGVAGRGLLLAVLVVLGAFGLANLTRNTGAALGIAFVYFAVVENVVRIVLPRFNRWLLLDNVGALVIPGGNEVPTGVRGNVIDTAFDSSNSDAFMTLSNQRGGLVLTVVVLAVLAIATVLFTRRDIT